jgi:APA family basic amino acid/polyamine antiporter
MEALPGPETAAGKVARALFGARGDLLVNVIIVVALLSTVNALLPMAARILFAMGSDGLFSRISTRVNAGGTPTVALGLSAGVAGIFVATGTFEAVLGILAVFFVANYLLSFTALILLRRRQPDVPRPYRAWGYPWTTLIAIAGSLAFLIAAIQADSQTAMLTGALIAASVPVYLLIRRAGRTA